MKYHKLLTLTLFATLLINPFSGCKKEDVNPVEKLPSATQTGANTFGCLVDGSVLVPRDGIPTFDNPYPHKGIEVTFNAEDKMLDLSIYNEKGIAPIPFFLRLHLVDFNNIQPGNYNWEQTYYDVGTTSYPLNEAYGSFYDNSINNYGWFGSYDGSGTITITRFDTANHVIAATFAGKLRKRDGTNEIAITDGRFDINWGTVLYKKFP